MINIIRTFKEFGYNPDNLSYGSGKRVWAICNECKKERLVEFKSYSKLCRSYSMKGKKHTKESKQKIRKFHIGKILSEETKQKISKSNSGKRCSEETKQKISVANSGENNPFYGKHHTEETKQKMRDNHNMFGENNPFYGKHHSEETKKNLSMSRKGNKHPRWNNNLTDEERVNKRNYPEYKEWREMVFKRDEYTCQICGKIGGALNAHHLNSYADNPNERTLLKNGVTLCEKHHKDFHHQYSRFNNTEEQFIEFKG